MAPPRGATSVTSLPACTRPDGQLPYRLSKFGEKAETGKRLGIRPVKGSDNPYATVAGYCSYDEAFGQYVSTQAWMKRILEEVGMVEKCRAFFCGEPPMKTGPSRRRGGLGSVACPSSSDGWDGTRRGDCRRRCGRHLSQWCDVFIRRAPPEQQSN